MSVGQAHKGKDAYFCDDGFAVGVAFVLAVLGQDEAFDALHWFDGVDRHIREENESVVAARKAAKPATSKSTSASASSAATSSEGGALTAEELDFKARRIAAVRHSCELAPRTASIVITRFGTGRPPGSTRPCAVACLQLASSSAMTTRSSSESRRPRSDSRALSCRPLPLLPRRPLQVVQVLLLHPSSGLLLSRSME